GVLPPPRRAQHSVGERLRRGERAVERLDDAGAVELDLGAALRRVEPAPAGVTLPAHRSFALTWTAEMRSTVTECCPPLRRSNTSTQSTAPLSSSRAEPKRQRPSPRIVSSRPG